MNRERMHPQDLRVIVAAIYHAAAPEGVPAHVGIDLADSLLEEMNVPGPQAMKFDDGYRDGYRQGKLHGFNKGVDEGARREFDRICTLLDQNGHPSLCVMDWFDVQLGSERPIFGAALRKALRDTK